MKHLLNNLSNEEKNSIREQHEGGISLDTSKFKKLLESQLGNVKPLVSERVGTTGGGSLPVTGRSINTTSNKPPITNVPKDKEGRSAGSCWYGFNSTSKMFTEGPCKGIAGKDFTTQCKPKRPNCSMPGGSGGGSISSTTGSTTSPQGTKTVTPKITIDCTKKLITSSQLPKFDRATNVAMNQGLISYYCQAGK